MPKKIRIPLPAKVEKVHLDQSTYTRKVKHGGKKLLLKETKALKLEVDNQE